MTPKERSDALATASALIRETAQVMRERHCLAPDYDLATMDSAVRVDYEQELRAADRLDALRDELEKAQPAAERVDCNTCANRGQLDGLSQETHCEHCKWQEQWRTDHYVLAAETPKKEQP